MSKRVTADQAQAVASLMARINQQVKDRNEREAAIFIRMADARTALEAAGFSDHLAWSAPLFLDLLASVRPLAEHDGLQVRRTLGGGYGLVVLPEPRTTP
jgi:class 3 adenylate cyclase